MTIGVFELIRTLPLAGGKKRLHLLFWMQGQTAPRRARTEVPSGTDLTIALRKLHLDEQFAGILDGCPARTGPTLWAGDRLGIPIDGEVREVVARLRLIPMRFERGSNQVHSIAHLRLDEISTRDIAGIDEMLLWEQFLLSQTSVDGGKHSLIADGSRSGLDMSDQLGSLFITSLAEMHLIADPQRASFLAIPCVQVIRGVNELSGWESRFSSP